MLMVAFKTKKAAGFSACGFRVSSVFQYVVISYRKGALSAGAAIAIIPVVIKAASA
jgi:hypothetical protein